MQEQDNTIRYILYSRKSTESEDRQVQSIDDQVRLCKEKAQRFGLKIVKIYTESKSAKKPDNRPLFSEMMKKIDDGEADGILCWHINRLSRNPIDSAQIQWHLQQRTIRSLQTIDREYLPDDNVLLFSVESGMANQYILDLGKSVKRGLQSKINKGWQIGLAPSGYLNDILNHTIIVDEERFGLVRQAWDLILTGNYTVPQVLDKLNNEWGFRTVKRKRSGNKPLAMSGLYKIFTNLFYAGIITYQEKEYPGKHKTMISLEEYDRVQMILGRKGKPRSQKYLFAYTGMIRCGVCGCSITAEKKKKIIKSTNEIHEYTYYRCTRKKKHINCKQHPIRKEDLEIQMMREIDKITILPEFKDWALEYLNESNDREIEDRTEIYEMQHKTLVGTQKQLDNLTQMRYREMITDEEYISQRQPLQKEIARLKDKLRHTEQRAEEWLELTEKTFKFATFAQGHFANGNMEMKKSILAAIGSNFILKDGKLVIQGNKWLEPIKKAYPALEKEYQRLELNKKPLNKAKTELLNSVIARTRGPGNRTRSTSTPWTRTTGILVPDLNIIICFNNRKINKKKKLIYNFLHKKNKKTNPNHNHSIRLPRILLSAYYSMHTQQQV